MTAPLYQGYNSPEPKPKHAHSGLWFDRFFNRYQINGNDWAIDQQDAKRDWITTVTGLVGQANKLQAHTDRQINLVRHLQGSSQRYITDWHFVTGMGNSHPVENGFSWHPTLGVPYLAGSAVKGLVRAWVERNEDALQPDEKNARLKRWFGTQDKKDVAEQAGGFLFFDAIPDEPPSLLCDIMTPHMGKWYSEGDKGNINNSAAIPADWHEPVPVPFLAVKKTRLVFSIAPRQPAMAEELNTVFAVLKEALEWLGAGAKTAAGYGYFSLDDNFSQEQAVAVQQQLEKERMASLSPEQQDIEVLRQLLQKKQAGKAKEQMGGELYNNLKELVTKTDNWPTETKMELLEVAKTLVEFINAKNNSKAKDLLKRLQ